MKKKLLSEFIGTFFLIFVGCGSIIVNDSNRGLGIIGVSLSFGLTLMIMIFLFGRISGAHFNPAISFSLFIMADIKFSEFILYILTQIMAGLFACFLLLIVFSQRFYNVVISVNLNFLSNSDVDIKFLIFILEFTFSILFGFIYIRSSSNNKIMNKYCPIFIGATYFTISTILFNLNGFGINPLRIVVPSIFKWNWENIQYYLIADFIGILFGGMLSSYFKNYRILKKTQY